MRGDDLGFFDGRRRDRERLTQMQLVRIGLRGEPFAFLTKVLAAEPLELVLEGCDLLGLRMHDDDELRGAHRTHSREVR